MSQEAINSTRAGNTSDVQVKTTANSISEATVVTSNPSSNVYLIRFEHSPQENEQAVWVGGMLSNLLGINTQFTIPAKTKVVVIRSTPISYIIGCKGSAVKYGVENDSLHNMENLNSTEFGKLKESISSLFAGGNSLLRHFASLDAGTLAKVECHLLDDMVRIISNKFLHHSAFGDYEIYNDGGRLNVEFHGAKYEYEALGNAELEDLKMDFDYENVIKEREDEDKYLETGRWRFSQYLGYLGNFINLFVNDPVRELGKIAESSVHPSGKFRAHVNNDGSLLMQSVGDIVLEKVCRICVPRRKRRHEDSSGAVMEEKRIDINASPLNFSQWAPSDEANIFENAYKLRDYAKWFSNYYSMSGFYSAEDDFNIPEKEEDVSEPVKDNDDPENAKQSISDGIHTKYVNAYSTIRIFRDGSIVLFDAYGSSITMAGGDVSIAATNNLRLESAGDINLIAGKNITNTARQHIEQNAITGAICSRGRERISMYSDEGTINLESNKESTEEDPDPSIILQGKGKITCKAEDDIIVKSQGGSVGISGGNITNILNGSIDSNDSTGFTLLNVAGLPIFAADMTNTIYCQNLISERTISRFIYGKENSREIPNAGTISNLIVHWYSILNLYGIHTTIKWLKYRPLNQIHKIILLSFILISQIS